MIRTSTLGLAVIAALAVNPVHVRTLAAQAVPQDSPFASSLSKDALLIAGAGGLVLAARASERGRTPLSIEEAEHLSPRSVNWFDRSATRRYALNLSDASESLSSVMTLAPLVLLADSRMRGDGATIALMYVESMMIASAIPTIVKGRYDRLRPYAYNPDLTHDEKTDRNPGGAFFSSQATYNFANAVFLSTVFSAYHPDSKLKPYVWAGALASASGIAYLRYASGVHYPSDLLVGALVGAGIGHLVPRLHRSGSDRVAFTPGLFDGSSTMAVNIAW